MEKIIDERGLNSELFEGVVEGGAEVFECRGGKGGSTTSESSRTGNGDKIGGCACGMIS